MGLFYLLHKLMIPIAARHHIYEESNFNQAIDITLKNEGGLSIDKDDPGGITKYGISLKFLEENGIDVNKDSKVNAKDVTDLTIEEAENIYKVYFWTKYKCYLIRNQTLANKIFDLSVNMGGKTAVKLLQLAINQQVKNKIVIDGVIGNATLSGIASIDQNLLLAQYKELACAYYKKLTVKNPVLTKYLKGWLKRANQ